MLRLLLQSFAGSLRALPGQCQICHAWPAQAFCDACIARFAQPVHRCRTCALRLPEGGPALCGACLQAAPPLDACRAAVSYGYPWADVIGRFKFDGAAGLARPLAMLVRSAPWVEPLLDAADMVLPLPLSGQRLRERGYNQALLLARALAPGKVDASVLLRVRHGLPNSSQGRAARMAAMRGALAVEPLRAARVAGRRVVLVDDVMTTGASLFAAAQALRRAGAREVSAAVLARTE